jgi:4-amino-4-deoxy-L-arabinose transferase-like glycosyltransferase
MTATRISPGHAQAAGGRPASGRLARLLRGRDEDPWWARAGLLAVLALTAVLYLAGLSRNGWANDFYAAAVQAGTKSWKAAFFGSFDSSSFITVDKTPASLWVMEISARIFGLNSWSILVPQALEGVASVAVLHAAVRRWSGPAAGLLAGTVLAITPVAALMFRFNNPDALLVLLMTGAAYAVTRAVEGGKTRWLVLAGTLIGFGFLAKMMQAFLVLPGFALVYLVAGPPRLSRRLCGLLAGCGALVAAAGSWVAAVMITPAADRPYVGGSTNDSILQLALGYNGLGRLDGNETGSVGFGGGGGAAFGGSAGLTRLFAPDMGGQASWLLPAALIAIAALLCLAGREPRASRTRAAALLWGSWLLVTGAVFSYMAGIIHPYYTVALTPAIGALTGIGAVQLWRARGNRMTMMLSRVVLAAGVLVTAVWAFVLLDRSASWLPWLRVLILAAGLLAAVILAGQALLSRPAPLPGPAPLSGPALLPGDAAPRGLAPARAAAPGRGRVALAILPVPLALFAALAGPAAYSVETARTAHTGSLPSAGPAVAASGGPGGAPGAARGGAAAQAGARGFPGAGAAPGGQPGSLPSGGRGAASAPGTGGTAGGRAPGGSSLPGAAGHPGGGAGGGPGGLSGNTTVSSSLTRLLKDGAPGYRWAAATVSSDSAAPLQLASGEPVMSIGGFNGTDPAPTLAQFERYVAGHEIHYFIGANSDTFGGGSGDAARITAWVKEHFRSSTVGSVTVYNLDAPVSTAQG